MSGETRDYRGGNADEDEEDPRAEMPQRSIEHASGPVVPALHRPPPSSALDEIRSRAPRPSALRSAQSPNRDEHVVYTATE